MDINIEEQEAKLKAEAQQIGEAIARQREILRALTDAALKNQGALDLLKGLVPADPPADENP